MRIDTLRRFVIFGIIIFPLLIAGCAALRGTHPAKVTRPNRSTATPPGQSTKETSPTGVQREVVRLETPRLAASRSPKRLASMEIIEQGKLSLKQRDFDKALQAFQEAAMVDGTNGIAYYYLARTRYELHQWTEALGLLERAESLLGDSDEWLHNVAELRGIIQVVTHQ